MQTLLSPFGFALVGFAAALTVALILTRSVRDRAMRLGFYDPIDARKLHTDPIPRVGGVGLFLAATLTLAALAFAGAFGDVAWQKQLIAVYAGATAMHLLGLADDFRGLRARHKLGVQVIVAVLVAAIGLQFTVVTIPIFGTFEIWPPFAVALTAFWLVGITNAFNLIDGLDGLAAGVALFALAAFFIVALATGNASAAISAAVVAGATFGFLRYNAHPATIFLGDSGSLFLGFMLAGLGLLTGKTNTGLSLAVSIAALAVPAVDAIITILRRFLRRQPIFVPDRGHAHHRLLMLGYSPQRVVHIMCGVSGICATAAVLLALDVDRFLVFAAASTLVLGFSIHKLRIHEFEELVRLLHRGSRPRQVIQRNVRFHEAVVRMSDVDTVAELTALLDWLFRGDSIRRAELRLYHDVLDHHHDKPGPRHAAVGTGVEVPVWACVNSPPPVGSIEIRLPLAGEDGRELGWLVLWEDAVRSAVSLSHLQLIAGSFRVSLERRVAHLAWGRRLDFHEFGGASDSLSREASGGGAA